MCYYKSSISNTEGSADMTFFQLPSVAQTIQTELPKSVKNKTLLTEIDNLFFKAYKADINCPFAIHLGDLINAKDNYPRFFQAMAVKPDKPVIGKELGDTVFYTLGNHDLYFNQWEEYKKYIPTSTYWFDTRTKEGKLLDLFICLDSGEGTLGVKPLTF